MRKFLLAISIIFMLIFTAAKADTLAYYMFEEGTDGNGSLGTAPQTTGWVVDSSAVALNGTVVNSGSFPEYSSEKSQSAPGNISMRFGATGNYVVASNSAKFQFSENASRTVEFFIKRAGDGLDPSATEFVMSKDYGSTNGWDIYISRTTGLLNFRIKNHAVSSQTDFRDGGWHHVAVVHAANSATYELFVDYRKEAELTGYGSGSVSEGGLYVGTGYGWQTLRSLNGYIDELRFSDAALTSSEFLRVEVDKASFPKPGSDAVIDDLSPTLQWIAGKSAVTHNVYFGQAADSQEFQTQTSSLSWAPGLLKPATTYYWRVDAVNTASPESPWVGDVWNFTTVNYVSLEDFESYIDEADLQSSWAISQDDPNNLQSAELLSIAQNVYHTGSQGLKMVYDFTSENTSVASFAPYYTNWQQADIRSISVYVLAPITNDDAELQFELSDGTNTSTVSYDDFTAIADGMWHEVNIDVSLFSNIDLSNIQSMSFIAAGTSGSGKIYFDDVRIYVQRAMGQQPGDITGDYMVTLEDFALLASQWHQDNIWP